MTIVLSMAVAPAGAQQVTLRVLEAHALHQHDDACGPLSCCCSQADFFALAQIATSATVTSPRLDGRDRAAWTPSLVASAGIDPTLRFYPFRVELWEYDSLSETDPFDISPVPGQRALEGTFDACLRTFVVGGTTYGGAAKGDAYTMPYGTEYEEGQVVLSLDTGDGLPLAPNDVMIREVTPIQAVSDPAIVVADKATVLKVDLASSWSVSKSVTISVEMSDGVTTVSDSRVVTALPGATGSFYFFDGAGTAVPYHPAKSGPASQLSYSARITVPGEVIGTGAYGKCILDNNVLLAAQIPIRRTVMPSVVFAAWDFAASPGTGVPSWPTRATVDTTRQANDAWRNAAYPLASVSSRTLPINLVSPYLGSIIIPEPAVSIFLWSTVAPLFGMDRLVLTPNNGWWTARGGLLAGPAIGMSLAEWAPHAVVAEAGYSEVADHELGHTYRLSQHNCSTGGLAEELFNSGCRDEYKHTSPPRAYVGQGYDVNGLVFPGGFLQPPILAPPPVGLVPAGTCPATLSGTHDVCAISFMDTTPATPSGPFDRWLDRYSYDFLAERLLARNDPELITIAGQVQALGGLDTAFGGSLLPAFHADGIPDVDEAAYGGFSESGRFEIRLVTAQGTRTYRFNPAFDIPEADASYNAGMFGFTVPWDPGTQSLELWGPMNPSDPADPQKVLLASKSRSANPPRVSTIRAGLGQAPTLAGPQPEPPTIGPGQDLVLAWDASDPDNDPVESALGLELPPNNSGITGFVPVSVPLDGTQLRLSHDQLRDLPGTYFGKVHLSDGVSGVEFTETAPLFVICNFTNGGVEICDQIDNDCNGVVDDTPLINDQPILTVGRTLLSWTPRCDAQAYDLASGDLGKVRVLGGNFGSATCLANDYVGTQSQQGVDPPPGSGSWYLVRVAGETWNDGNQMVSRDATLAACP